MEDVPEHLRALEGVVLPFFFSEKCQLEDELWIYFHVIFHVFFHVFGFGRGMLPKKQAFFKTMTFHRNVMWFLRL